MEYKFQIRVEGLHVNYYRMYPDHIAKTPNKKLSRKFMNETEVREYLMWLDQQCKEMNIQMKKYK